MKQWWPWIGVVVTMGLVGCASTDSSSCGSPRYVVPPPLPPLRIPAGMSAPADHSQYRVNAALLSSSGVHPAPGTGQEAVPPSGPATPMVAQKPAAPVVAPAKQSSTSVPAGLSGPPLSETQSTMSGGNSTAPPPLIAAPTDAPSS